MLIVIIPVPADLSELSHAVKNDAVKNDVYNAKIENIEDKISDITNLTTTATLNAKITQFKNKISNIINLATNTTLAAVENIIPDHSKYFTTQ